MLLFFWLILFGFVTQNISVKYGIPYLFLNPEYMGNVGFISHLVLGLACGGFIMAFNISSYIINGFRFPFIATLSRPFLKYCINNFIIPIAFLGVYIYHMISFQLYKELEPTVEVLANVAGFLAGNFIFIALSFLYFRSTNKNLSKLFGKKEHEVARQKRKKKEQGHNPVKAVLHRRQQWYNVFNRNRQWRVDTYLSNFFRISLARDSSHYGQSMLKSVFEQNHINASLFEIFVIVTILFLGLFREMEFFVIPASASVFLLMSMLLMIFSALHSWLRGWSTTVFIALFLVLNFLTKYETFNYTNYAYGMNYNTEKAVFSDENIKALSNDFNVVSHDIMQHIEILNKWRLNNLKNTLDRNEKPKLVMINTSGGGLRSAMWTFHSLQYADSILNGQLLKHTHLITGSSGGMIGAAYLRENYLRSQSDSTINIYADTLVANIGKDVLNPLAFTIAVNDLVVRLQKFRVGKHAYTKDRGYAFEKQFNKNTNWILNKRLCDYRLPEANADIPMMVLTPTIVNDGRRMIIASQPVSYLSRSTSFDNVTSDVLVEGIEFSRFFKNQEADSLLFMSALRMNATFPYIMPVVSLPSDPTIDVMDAGIRDNFGLATTLKFLYTFRNWINTNTSGVIIIQTRDKSKGFEIEDNPLRSILQSLSNPIGSFYSNWPNIQNFNQDQLLQYASLWFEGEIDVIPFELQTNNGEGISLSWHLTRKEKKQLLDAINLPKNQKAIERLKELLD